MKGTALAPETLQIPLGQSSAGVVAALPSRDAESCCWEGRVSGMQPALWLPDASWTVCTTINATHSIVRVLVFFFNFKSFHFSFSP